MSSGLGRGDIAQFGAVIAHGHSCPSDVGNGARRQRFDSETIALHGLVYDQRARVEYISPPRGAPASTPAPESPPTSGRLGTRLPPSPLSSGPLATVAADKPTSS